MKKNYWKAEDPTEIGFKVLSDSDMKSPTKVEKSDTNRIYYYVDVSDESCLDLNKALQEKSDELRTISLKNGFGRPTIYLHISSFGGKMFAGISSMDTILRLKKDVDIITIVEGGVASAGTFLSVVGTKRWMTENSYMLIHQLTGSSRGKYSEQKDAMENIESLMEFIRETYKKYTKVPKEELDKILDHDLWWDANKCLEMKLVDKII
jgi:ATP-dependent Clp endopeptidase proteolytic subunit ClpP